MAFNVEAETNVVRWLESRLTDAVRLADVLAALEELDGRDGVRAAGFDPPVARSACKRADSVGALIADVEGRRASLECQRAEIAERLDSARAVLRRARAGASPMDVAKLDYCERRYIDAMPRRKAAEAVGAGEWAARSWPRSVAPLLLSCEPDRFDYVEDAEPLGYWLI